MINRMILNQTSYFGAGAVSAIVDEIKKRGFGKALVVTDKDLIKFHVADKVTSLLYKERITSSRSAAVRRPTPRKRSASSSTIRSLPTSFRSRGVPRPPDRAFRSSRFRPRRVPRPR